VFIWRGPNGWLNQHIFKVHPKECCEEQFFFYLLKYLNPNFVRIARNKQTTGLGHVTKKDLQNISVKLPLPPEQRAIFKSWFIDFDPVIDNALRAGNPIPDSMAERAEIRRQILDQNQNDELRIVNSEKRKKIGLENSPFTPHNSPFDSLFPDSFEDSEVGEIPTGWEVKAIGDVAEFAYGKALKASDRKPGDVPVFGSNGQVGLHNEALVKGPGIVIGRKGNPGIVTWLYEDFSPLIQPSMSREQELF
ncbi:MAG: restriction endonuclease subunit S, partial [Candidatus Brocadiaceae bacterium]|nr:restriction endonuclease subunit S [Candidatus Brocadiaceae bacterium]